MDRLDIPLLEWALTVGALFHLATSLVPAPAFHRMFPNDIVRAQGGPFVSNSENPNKAPSTPIPPRQAGTETDVSPAAAPIDKSNYPPLFLDPSFHGMTITQFLGAFNDNLFKQLMLLLCVDLVAQWNMAQDFFQPFATAVFSIPFVLFSGVAGYLADRNSKRTIVIACKFAEIGIMLLAMLAFASSGAIGSSSLIFLFIVLFLMGTHSAFFGPSKYGILPELVRDRDLPQFNGIIQLTTFLAIIFGQVTAGFLRDNIPVDQTWMASGVCVAIAVMGAITSFLVRRTPVAIPGLRFSWASLAVSGDTWRLILRERMLLLVLLISSLFWGLAGIVNQAVNAYGILQLKIDNTATSLLQGCIALGIAFGCVLAGKLSVGHVRFRLVTIGAWGISTTLFLLGFVAPVCDALAVVGPKWPAGALLFLMGICCGLFAVPLQVFLQVDPPADQKGRIIGCMNLFNWIGIFLGTPFYLIMGFIFEKINVHEDGMFVASAVLLLPVALFFHPPDRKLS